MVNELGELLRDQVASAPPERTDLDAILRAGRRRTRRRRTAAIGGTAIAMAAAVGVTAVPWPGGAGVDAADGVPTPDAPTLTLADARPAAAGTDYRVLATHTNEHLDRRNGQYFDGVTDDGLILFRDGPHGIRARTRWALLDPATGEKDWLPEAGSPTGQAWPVALEEDRLVLAAGDHDGRRPRLVAHVFDRARRTWTEMQWPDLPRVDDIASSSLGPDGRLYVTVLMAHGRVPEGGWPMENGEADDSNADGAEYRLWSVSLTDAGDVRDEELTVGEFDFTDEALVWSEPDRVDGNGRIHVRDLATGEEQSFDPNSGEKCNLLTFGATGDRIVLGQYCGDYEDAEGNPVRDDRVQILSTDGEQVVTIQDDGVAGWLPGDGDVVTVESYAREHEGTFVYDLATDRFLRVSEEISSYAVGGPAPGDMFLWHTPVGANDDPAYGSAGAKQWLGELVR